jgi:hypothetical protein
MIFYLLIIAIAIGCIIFAVSYSETETKKKIELTDDVPEYPERTYRIVPNDKGNYNVEEYVGNYYNKIKYDWHFANTYEMRDTLGRQRKNHAYNVTLEEAQEYIRKKQIEDAECLAEIEAAQKHIADNPPKIFMPGISPPQNLPTQEEATTLANAFPEMGLNIDKINDMIKNRALKANATFESLPDPNIKKPSKRRFPGVSKSKKFRKFEE